MRTSYLVAVGIVVISAAATVAATEPEYKTVFSDDFEHGMSGWEILDPKTWAIREQPNGSHSIEILKRDSEYQPPHRSPLHVALVKDLEVGDCDITFRVRSTLDTGNHRDCCVFFGYQDNRHFYYVHLGAKPDPHSGQIMIVNDAPRLALTENKRLVPWDNKWHKVKLQRRLAEGSIRVFFDDMDTPLMEVKDQTFGRGRVGIGSFDDLNEFDDLEVRTPVEVATAPAG
jgi:hypothetical protein